jgi:hypothetical protein
MTMNKNLTTVQVENIPIDSGVVYKDYGETTERMLAPTRGGGEFTVTNKIRNIERDGAKGPEMGLQVIEEQIAMLKVNLLSFTQADMALAAPGCAVEQDGSITNGAGGVIGAASYFANITMFAKLVNGKYKKIQIFNPMHEGDFGLKAIDKAEGELALEVSSHFDPADEAGIIWRVSEISDPDNAVFAVTSVAGTTSGDSLITATGKTPGNPMLYKKASSVTLPAVGTDLSADNTWSPFTSGIDYTATTGHDFAVADVSTGGLVVKRAKVTVVSKA